jgi:RsiW-degrading membrane proteinase PrsW (M82 family)
MSKPNRSKNSSLRLSEMLPILGKRNELRKKGFLIPGILTVLVVIGLFITIDNAPFFNLLLTVYLLGGSYYFIYRQAGTSKPWWLLLGAFITTPILLCTPVWNTIFVYVFRHILPGNISDADTDFFTTFLHHFFGAGMCEELFKSIPVFLALVIGRTLKSPQREQIGVWEPLDGIVLATASAAGFTFIETLAMYVPEMVKSGGGELAGLQLLIPRIIASVFGHMAYSGYFGYFIGLSVLKPSKRWQILGIGYLTAATLHGLWNAADGGFGGAGVGILAYIFLIAAILKARQLSPTRAQNWATQYVNPLAPQVLAASPPSSQAALFLSIQQRSIPLNVGTQLQVNEIPGLGAQSRGIVAEVAAHPQNPNTLGLKNCSDRVWIVTLDNGQQPTIDPGRNIKLVPGTKINFGAVMGEIRCE